MEIIQKKMRTLSLNSQSQVQSAQLRYVVSVSPDDGLLKDEDILTEVFTQAPEKIGSSAKSGVELLECGTPDIFEVAVSYTTVSAQIPDNVKRASVRHGDKFWSSKCSLSKEKCYEALEHQKIFPAEGAIYCGAGHSVMWNGRFGEDSNLDGIDKLLPRCEEFCRKYIFASQCDSAFRKKIMELVGKVNFSAFRSWAAKEVMLSKIEISEPFLNDLEQSIVEVEYAFSIRRHRKNVNWCGIDVGKVNAWDHLWGTFYADPSQRSVRSNCAYVGRLYDSGDFGILGLED